MNKKISFSRILLGVVIGGLLLLNIVQFMVPVRSEKQKIYITPSEAAALYHAWFYADNNTWLTNTWLGVPAMQNPNDVWIMQEIITETKPDVIVETGTARGGGALIWATILQQVNPDGRVITIDIRDAAQRARELPLARQCIDFVIGSSTDSATIRKVKEETAGRTVLVILDALHTRAHVLKELELYAPLVSVGSYIIVQDSDINGHPVLKEYGPGPWEAIEDFLKTTDRFQIDKTRERFLFTMHPNGFLRRVK